MTRLPARVSIDLAPNDARRLVALTETRKGYDTPAHRADVAGELLHAGLDPNPSRADFIALITNLTDSAEFYRTQFDLPYQTAEDLDRWQANATAFETAAAALSTLLDNGAL